MSSAFRFVTVTEAQTSADAARLVERESGGALTAIGCELVAGGWKIHVASADGHNKLPSAPQHHEASALVERREFASVQEQVRGWTPYSNPSKPGGKN